MPYSLEVVLQVAEAARQREQRQFMQARLAEMVTAMRGRAAHPVTIEETEAMDALELLALAKVCDPGSCHRSVCL